MNFTRALLFAVVLYALIFLIASGLMFVFELGSMAFKVTVPIVVAVLTFVIAYFYFKGVKVTNAFTDGLVVGVVFAVVAFLIDIPAMVYGFQSELGWAYFTQWDLMLGYVLTVIMPILAAFMKK